MRLTQPILYNTVAPGDLPTGFPQNAHPPVDRIGISYYNLPMVAATPSPFGRIFGTGPADTILWYCRISWNATKSALGGRTVGFIIS